MASSWGGQPHSRPRPGSFRMTRGFRRIPRLEKPPWEGRSQGADFRGASTPLPCDASVHGQPTGLLPLRRGAIVTRTVEEGVQVMEFGIFNLMGARDPATS